MTQENTSELEPRESRISKCKTHMSANVWLFVTTATYLVTLFVRQDHKDWPPAFLVTLALLPLLPGLIYLRQLWGSFKALDELQRRMQLEAWGLAMAGTVVVSTTMNLRNANGVGFENYPHGLEIDGVYITMFMLWSIGTGIATACYR